MFEIWKIKKMTDSINMKVDFIALNYMHESENWTGVILLENKKKRNF